MNTTVGALAWIALLLPLVGGLTIAFFFRNLSNEKSGKAAGVLASAVLGSAFIFSIATLVALQRLPADSRHVSANLWNYVVTAGLNVKVGLYVDPLSVIMMLVVTGVSTMIHLYATSYMESDRGYARFFSYLNLFVFSMLLLVLAGNLVLLTVGWAFVGAASYLLVSFWYRRKTATKAGIKAFVINVAGDVGIVLGSFLILRHTGSVEYVTIFARAESGAVSSSAGLEWGLVFILIGAFAKSAQFPLHTWLPDAMEGPTPVSALIHAATMVTAGVYLIARMYPLFQISHTAALIGGLIGTITLMMAATIAMVQTDLKRVIAYSTMSQVGYMILAVSGGAYAAGIFHLMTHAFFKALLFMGAGSVISAMGGNQNMNDMGGWKRALPYTYATFLCGAFALAGCPPFSGFWSKDEILSSLLARGGVWEVLAGFGYAAAFLTAIYTFRMVFRVFHGPEVTEVVTVANGRHVHVEPTNPSTGELEDTEVGFPGKDHHWAEHSILMKIAMGVLAFGAVTLGALQLPGLTDVISNFLEPTFKASTLASQVTASTATTDIGLAIGTVLSISGILIARHIWLVKRGMAASIQERFQGLHTFLFRTYFINEFYDAVIVRPVRWLGAISERDLVGRVIIGAPAGATRGLSALVRSAQTGSLRLYAAAIGTSTAVILLFALVVR